MNKKILAIATILMTTIMTASVLATAVPKPDATASAVVQCYEDSQCYQVLNLCTKDANWKCTQEATATLITGSPQWSLTTTGLTAKYGSSELALIYYPDHADRFTPSYGAGGIVIKTFTGDQAGLLINPPAINLPIAWNGVIDWNSQLPADYCVSDGYAHCQGAKIWIVPVSDLSPGPALPVLAPFTRSDYLFETDLLTYTGNTMETCVGYPPGIGVCEQVPIPPKTCGISASDINFGSVIPGTNGPVFSTISDVGTNPTTSLTIKGTDWSPYMAVGQTSWDDGSGYKPLTKIDTSVTGLPLPKNINFQLTVPSGQATGAYSQTITFTASCE